MKNPIVPYILIMAFGIGLIFFMSMYGVDKKEEIAQENGEEQTTENQNEGTDSNKSFDPESFAQENCISCHGNALEGSVGPALKGTKLSKEEIVTTLKNGKGMMPPFPDIDQAAMADYILSLK